jgi:DNA-binding XRE family transcriptional regulator
MKASSKLPTEQRPTRYVAVGLQAAREAASMTQAEVADIAGYNVGVVQQMERGQPFHTVRISRVSSAIPGHDLSQIRQED